MTQNHDVTHEKRPKDDAAEAEATAPVDESPGDESPGDPPRKERVIHTRVPAVLEKELKRLATSLRVPVSNVVRAILEDAVAAVDRVGHKAEGELHRAADRLAHQRDRLRAKAHSDGEEEAIAHEGAAAAQRDPLEDVLGYQPLILASDAECVACGKALRKGREAYLGLRDQPGPRVLIGPECLPGLQSQPNHEENDHD